MEPDSVENDEHYYSEKIHGNPRANKFERQFFYSCGEMLINIKVRRRSILFENIAEATARHEENRTSDLSVFRKEYFE